MCQRDNNATKDKKIDVGHQTEANPHQDACFSCPLNKHMHKFSDISRLSKTCFPSIKRNHKTGVMGKSYVIENNEITKLFLFE